MKNLLNCHCIGVHSFPVSLSEEGCSLDNKSDKQITKQIKNWALQKNTKFVTTLKLNGMEVICTNGTFSPEQLQFFNQYNVGLPQEGSIYSIRGVIKHTNGSTGFLLEELQNPAIPCSHPILGKIFMEPTFSTERFSTLFGKKISLKQVDELTLQNN